KKFQKICLNKIYASHLRRAKQTAMIIARPHKLKVYCEENLRERSYGVMEGMTREEFKQKFPQLPPHEVGVDWKPKGGESMRQVTARIVKAFKKIVRQHKPGERILIVSHGGALRCLLHSLHGGKLEEVWERKPIDNGEITEVHWDGKKAKIISSYK
ncbi:MAG: histidine phosphatase family protein, partial [Nanoarchaeota archaeon]|nr:histidine phosphatase family protein [Nanoarchaeota archaeon]